MAELGQTSDPTALIPGSVDSVTGMATVWRSAAQTATTLSNEVLAISSPQSWTGDAASGFDSRRTKAGQAWAGVAAALTSAAEAVSAYAETLAWAQQQAREAIALWETAQQLTVESRRSQKEQARLAGPTVVLPPTVDGGAASRVAAREIIADARAQVVAAGDTAASAIRTASGELQPPAAGWTALGTLAVLAAGLSAHVGTVVHQVVLTTLQELASSDPAALEAYLDEHPTFVERFRDHPPTAQTVNDWWEGIQDTAVHQALITAAPAILGSLGGLPPLIRVAANRENARHRLAELDADIARAEQSIAKGGRYATPGALESLEDIRAERDYMQRAVDGNVQLYLYERGNQSVVELIGTPDESTTTTVTYVPGTFTSMHSFYDESEGSVREVLNYLNQRDPSVVGFVWKDGPFPGEDMQGDVNPFRIAEANDPARSEAAGERLAAFQREIDASNPDIAESVHSGMGHSWGLTPVVFAEEEGIKFDQVHSLAGAGLPDGWQETQGTTYDHWAYTDILTMAQETGAVWDGNVPARDSAFESHIFEREGDFDVVVPYPSAPGSYGMSPVPPPVLEASSNALDNHNLIASSRAENQSALRDILRSVRAG